MLEGPSTSKPSVSLRLTEPHVFLRGADPTGRRRTQRDEDPDGAGAGDAPALVRGLLVLHLPKPTKISSIDVQLSGRTSTAWPDGIGSRRIEIAEDHTIYSATSTFFSAAAPATSSFLASRRAVSIDPRAASAPSAATGSGGGGPDDAGPSRGRSRGARRLSADRTHFQREPVHFEEHVHALPHADAHGHLPPTPPYTPVLGPVTAPPSAAPSPFASRRGSVEDFRLPLSAHDTDDPAEVLASSRHALLAEMERDYLQSPPHIRRRSQTPLTASAASSMRSPSRRVPFDEAGAAQHIPLSPPPAHHSPVLPSPTGAPVLTAEVEERQRSASRGRTKSRFSLTAMLERVRSKDPPAEKGAVERGRPREKGERAGGPSASPSGAPAAVFGGDDEAHGDGWREFRRGTYTYPVSFALPASLPATVRVPFGSVVYTLRATVHRPGAFTAKLSAAREVVLVAAPGEDEQDESESVVIERAWEDQMQYLIAIGGRRFAVGSAIPLEVRFMPIEKVSVWRISVFIDEKVEYMTNMTKVARSGPPRRVTLFAMRAAEDAETPLLPLNPDHAASSPLHALLGPSLGPAAALHDPGLGADEASEALAGFMGPGPWHSQLPVALPTACGALHPSAKNRRSNIAVTHSLKIVFRVTRGDDAHLDAKGKRKMFDIVVQTPVQILSCLCRPDMTHLPRYFELGAPSPPLSPRPALVSDPFDLRPAPVCACHASARSRPSTPAGNVTPVGGPGPHSILGAPGAPGLPLTLPPLPSVMGGMGGHHHIAAVPGALSPTTAGARRPPASRQHSADESVMMMTLESLARRPPSASRSASRSASAFGAPGGELYPHSEVWERLVAGAEDEEGEQPPRYDEVVA